MPSDIKDRLPPSLTFSFFLPRYLALIAAPFFFYSGPHRLLRIYFQPDALPLPCLPEMPLDPTSNLQYLSPRSVTTAMIQHPVLSWR